MHSLKKLRFIRLISLSLVFILAVGIISVLQNSGSLGFGKSRVPTPTPFNPFPYKIPKIAIARSYRIVLAGDSITEALGPNANLLRQHLIEYYPKHEFVNYNYGYGASNMESLKERITKETEHNSQKFQSILSLDFDMIIIESFAYNPLSGKNKKENLEKYLSALDENVRTVIKNKPASVIALMTPIAPSKQLFAKGVYDLKPDERKQWAEERIGYIEAVAGYANKNRLPLINVYEKSLTAGGEADLKYINPDDYIHPSSQGVDLIAKTIAEFIYTNKIFPE